MRKNLIIAGIILIIIVAGGFYYLKTSNTPTVSSTQTSKNSVSTPTLETSSSSGKNESTQSYNSPNGEYTAMTYSNEDGDIETYILDRQGNKVTPLYCGAFDSWSPDSTKIKVYIQSECGYSNKDQYYYLMTNGVRETLTGSSFVPVPVK